MRLFNFFRSSREARGADRPVRNIREVDKVFHIAMRECVILHHSPSHIHTLIAALYCLQHIDSHLFGNLNMNILTIREWAVKNLDSTAANMGVFTGDLSFSYQVIEEPGIFRLHTVFPNQEAGINRKAETKSDIDNDDIHDVSPRKGVFKRRVIPEDYWKGNQEFFTRIRKSGNAENPKTTLMTLLIKLLDMDIVQICLSDLGYSTLQLRTNLECDDDMLSHNFTPRTSP